MANEYDDRGRLVYGTVIITVPRQAGKTAMVLATSLHRSMFPGRRCWYTAQTGVKAREQFIEMIKNVERSPLSIMTNCKRGAGDTHIEVPHVDSVFKCHPPTAESMHSSQSDLNIVDEGWVFSEAEGSDLEGAFVPAMSTRRMLLNQTPQVIIVSTAGTAESEWFHQKVAEARAGKPGVCLIDYGIADDADSEDLEVVAAAHPGFGHVLDMETLIDARSKMTAGEFRRAYGNVRTGAGERSINADAFTLASTTAPIPDDARLVFAVAASIDGEDASITAAATVNGMPMVEVIDARPGTSWVAERVTELSGRHSHAAVGIDPIGPAGTIASELSDLHSLHRVSTEEMTTACAETLERIHRRDLAGDGERRPAIRLRTHPSLATAAEVAVRRPLGDRWVWSRRGSVGSIASLEAGSIAAYLATHLPESVTPEVYFA